MEASTEQTNADRADVSATVVLVGNRYRLESTLGTGGMGRVHLATDTRTGEYVAVKTLRPDLATDILVRSRLQREAFIGARVQSRYVAQVLDHGEDEKLGTYIVFEYLEGEPLADLIDRRKTLTIVEAVEIAVDALRGLESFHHVGITHRDVKPDNIFLVRESGLRGTSRLGARLIDFGLSRAIVARSDGTERVTMEGIVAGTPEYMAPEQISDGPDQDARVDLYAMGVVLYQMIAGQLPFRGTQPDAVFDRVLHGAPPSLERACPGVDPDLARKIHRAMERDPRNRFATATAMRLELSEWLKRYHAGLAHARPNDATTRMPALRASKLVVSVPKKSRQPAFIVAVSACVTLITTLSIARIQRPPARPAATTQDAQVSPSPVASTPPPPPTRAPHLVEAPRPEPVAIALASDSFARASVMNVPRVRRSHPSRRTHRVAEPALEEIVAHAPAVAAGPAETVTGVPANPY